MNCYLELSVPFVTSGATMFFMLCLFVLFFLNFSSSFEPHKHGSVAPGSPPEGRKNSLAMYKKEQVKPKMLFLMSFLYCSLVSFFVTVYDEDFQTVPNDMETNITDHMELQTFKETFVTEPCCPS